MPLNENPRPSLSRRVVGEALETMDWPRLRDHLQSISCTDNDLEKVAEWVIRAPNIICKRPNPVRQNQREQLLRELAAFASAIGGETAARCFSSQLEVIVKIEAGYASLLANRLKGSFATLAPTTRVAGVLAFAARMNVEFRQAMDARIKRTKTLTDSSVVTDAHGLRINIDATNTALVEAASMTCLIEAHQNRWFDADGVVILPEICDVSDEEVAACEAGVESALCWRNWQQTEERRRFFGGTFHEFEAPNMPDWASAGFLQATRYVVADDDVERLDNIANERLRRGLVQTFHEMMGQTNIATLAKGLADDLAIGHGLIVSAEEGHAVVTLSETLACAIIDDQVEYKGLRLVEWLRGYAIIKEFTGQNCDAWDATTLLPTISRSELSALLARLGLGAEKAEIFIQRATFHRSSRDLFDQPLIQLSSGDVALFAPALLSAGLSEIVLSCLGNLKVTFDQKGKVFEDHIRAFLNEQEGVTAKTIKVTRNGEEYEFDILAHWEGVIFLFECKTHALSKGVPQNAYYFRKQAEKDARQTRRLLDALKAHPDILNDLFADGAAKLPVIPCVLNALPYAIPGGLDGIAFYDAPSLKRFFQNRHLHFKALHKIEIHHVLHRIAVKDFWGGDVPSPTALIEQIMNPFQIFLAEKHTELYDLVFPLNDSCLIAAAQYRERPMTQESIAEIYNVDINSIVQEQAAMTNAVEQIREMRSANEG